MDGPPDMEKYVQNATFARVHPSLREPAFLGFDAPCRIEAEVFDCYTEGEVPKEIDGTFYRVSPDIQTLPKYEGEADFNGDGMISAFRFRDGNVDFKSKYVRTEKLVRERRARMPLVGKYRNAYTDNPIIGNALRTTANTNIVSVYGRLLALKEDALPYELDPHTLRTKGIYNFEGQYNCPTFTAHPKTDATNGETIVYGYEAKGEGSRDVAYFLFDKNGKKIEEFWFMAPYCGLMHDVAFTPNYVIFQIYPLVCDVERLKRGGNHWVYDETLPMYLCMIPRYSPTQDKVQWFHWEPDYFESHWSNAFEKDGKVYADMPITHGNVMSWFPDKYGRAPPRPSLKVYFARFELDPNAQNLRLPDPVKLCDMTGEFSRIDDRFQGQPYEWTYFAGVDMTKPYDAVKSKYRPFPGFNTIGRMNNKTGIVEHFFPGPCSAVNEPAFIPRSPDAPEGDGFVVCLVANFDTELSDLIVLDTRDWTKAACVVKLPLRVRNGLHGNFVPREAWGKEGQDKELVDFEWVPATPGGIVDPLISASMLPEHLRGSHSVFTGHVGDRGVDGFYSESLGENKVIE